MVVKFYSDLFRFNSASGGEFIKGYFPILEVEECEAMEKTLTLEET